MERLPGVGEASIFKGDPRRPKAGIDPWFQAALTRQNQVYSRPHLYGADAGFCARRNVLHHHNDWLANETTPASNAYMSIGVALENMLAEGLHRQGSLIWQSYPLLEVPEVKVRGKADLLIFDHQDRLAIVEVKTCGALPTEPKPHHLAQIQTYVALTGLRLAYLTYLSRNVNLPGEFGPNLALRSFLVDTSEAALTNRLRIALLSRAAAQAGHLPPVPATFRKHTECHVCEFRDYYCYNPRPGLGGSIEAPPLPEYTTEQYIALDQSCQHAATQMYLGLPTREIATLKDLIQADISPSHKEKLMELLTTKVSEYVAG